jgi:hypothetical protein
LKSNKTIERKEINNKKRNRAKSQTMESDSPPVLNASHPNAEADADPNTDVLASKSNSEKKKKKKKENIGLAVGNMDDMDANREEVDEANVEAIPLRKLAIAMFVLFVIGMVITFSIVFPRKDEPTAPTMSRFSIMSDGIGSSFEDDFPSSTLQEEALIWLVDQDPAYLAVDTDSTTLLERYTAAHFYFAMQGTTLWTNQTGWLSENPVCSWRGIFCKEQGILTFLGLSTCLLASFCL